MTDHPPPCPKCHGKAVPIVWGMPTLEDFKAAERGELYFGGCVVEEDMPAWHCRACGHEFGE